MHLRHLFVSRRTRDGQQDRLVVVQPSIAGGLLGGWCYGVDLLGANRFNAVNAKLANRGTDAALWPAALRFLFNLNRNLRHRLFRQAHPFRDVRRPLLHRQFGAMQVLAISHSRASRSPVNT